MLRCLQEDFDYLVEQGHRPGYIAGAWNIHDAVPGWLSSNGFRYDVSRRRFPLSYSGPQTRAGDGHTVAECVDGLVQLPTSAPATMLAAARLRGQRYSVDLSPGVGYEMLYLHDYDLCRARVRAAMHVVERLARADRTATARELAESLTGWHHAAGKAAATT